MKKLIYTTTFLVGTINCQISRKNLRTQLDGHPASRDHSSLELRLTGLGELIDAAGNHDTEKMKVVLDSAEKRVDILRQIDRSPLDTVQKDYIRQAIRLWPQLKMNQDTNIRTISRDMVTSSIQDEINKMIQETDFRISEIHFGNIPSSWRAVFEQYPIDMNISKKRRVVIELLELNKSHLDLPDFLKIYSKQVGPIMHKLMQKMIETLPESQKDVKNQVRSALQSSVDPITETRKQELIRDLFPDVDLSQVNVSEQPKITNLKSASIGQVVRVEYQDQVYVVKVKRDGIENAVRQDREKFSRLMHETGHGDPSTQDRFNDIADGIERELNFDFERANIDEANKRYKGWNAQVDTIQRHPSDKKLKKIGLNNKYLIMTEAPGKPLSEILNELDSLSPKKQNEIKSALAETRKMWTLEAFTRSGFYHGDPHPGNFHVVIGNDHTPAKVIVLDYGNTNVMDLDAKYSTILLGIGLNTHDPDKIVQATKLALKPGQKLPNNFRQMVINKVYSQNDYMDLLKSENILVTPQHTTAFTALLAIEDWDSSFIQGTGKPIGNSFRDIIKANKLKFGAIYAKGYIKHNTGAKVTIGSVAAGVVAAVAVPLIMKHGTKEKDISDSGDSSNEGDDQKLLSLASDNKFLEEIATGHCFSKSQIFCIEYRLEKSLLDNARKSCLSTGNRWSNGNCHQIEKTLTCSSSLGGGSSLSIYNNKKVDSSTLNILSTLCRALK